MVSRGKLKKTPSGKHIFGAIQENCLAPAADSGNSEEVCFRNLFGGATGLCFLSRQYRAPAVSLFGTSKSSISMGTEQ